MRDKILARAWHFHLERDKYDVIPKASQGKTVLLQAKMTNLVILKIYINLKIENSSIQTRNQRIFGYFND